MSFSEDQSADLPLSDAVAAAAFRRLIGHLQHRTDAQNIDLMGLAGFCRNCLSDWVMEAANEHDGNMSRDDARLSIYGIDYVDYKTRFQTEATPEQLARMEESIAKNAPAR